MSDDIVREFLVESNENLDSLDRELVFLEKEPQSRDTLASVFRSIHTLKGTCGFLGFTKLESVAHVGENLLSKLRDGELVLTPEITTALLKTVDAIRQMLESIEQQGSEGERDDSGLIQTLTVLQKKEKVEAPAAAATVAAPKEIAQELAKPITATQAEVVVPTMGEILVERGAATAEEVAEAVSIQAQGDPRRLGEILVEHGAVKPREIVEALQTQQAARGGASEASIRVNVDQLDKLMNLVGELVLARNQILQFTSSSEDAGVTTSTQRLNHITTELQEGVMKTRMQPIGNIWSKFPRTVRDVATSCGKKVRIEMEGQGTELDKTIIESIKDPLTHLVRNSVDHGIEAPAKRVAAGKAEEGVLSLRAFHEGGQVILEITDDGAGLDTERIRSKALQRGLITPEQAGRLSEREVANLIFMPGFSTADKVTNVSGRGVGMDVVKTNIEKIGGTVDVQSRLGAGTTVRMKIPLTLAIIPALIVTTRGDRYAIPQVSLLELVRLEQEQIAKAIELVQEAPVYRLRERLLPLVYLNEVLGIEMESGTGRGADKSINIVVLQADERQFGLVVDEVLDTQEIVVKPLGQLFKKVDAFAGVTILGDGRVALILDVPGIAQRGKATAGAAAHSPAGFGAAKDEKAANRKKPLLLFQCGSDGRMAIDLSLVARLEEISMDRVERSGDAEVVQYRGRIMPLLPVAELLRRKSTREEGSERKSIDVIVYSDKGASVGLVVDRILDIVEEVIEVQELERDGGVYGRAVVQQKVTDLLDVSGLLKMAGVTQ